VTQGPGAFVESDGARFRVWASKHESLSLHLHSPVDRVIPMELADDELFEVFVPGLGDGARYKYRFEDGREYPDPASRFQPEGVHGASALVCDGFSWTDEGWRGVALDRYIIYELHIGTFTHEGTFDSAIVQLPRLVELGITAVEVMPIAQFPGERNWGYDGAYPAAVQNSYGGPDGFKRFVDAAHQSGLAVVLDVVYNHLGPEGNYLNEYAGYFTDRYKTPWGLALNFDCADSDHVREYFIRNAIMWLEQYHVDALRVDAIHAIVDHSAYPFLAELSDRVHACAPEAAREWYLIAESDLNDPRIIRPSDQGGFGYDSQWSDDFHHSLHTLLTSEDDGYYADYGQIEHFADAVRSGYAFRGGYSPFRRRKFGADPGAQPGGRFVVCAQNHDQIGNRMFGERLTTLTSFEKVRLAAAAVMLSPFIPMIFMGEEFAETAPFLYFTSHSDEGLIESVRRGRKREFKAFEWKGEAPDPHALETFERSRLGLQSADRRMLALYRELIRVRREEPGFRSLDGMREVTVAKSQNAVAITRGESEYRSVLVLNFSESEAFMAVPEDCRELRCVISSEDSRWSDALRPVQQTLDEAEVILPPLSFVFYVR